MTCIVGLVDNGVVYIGGDSAGAADQSLTIRADSKVFAKDLMIFGFTSSFRMGQLIRYKFDILTNSTEMDDHEYMCTTFIDGLLKCLKDGGYAEVDKEVVTGGTFLVGYNGRLYRVESDFQVGESVHGFDACGCGESYALGALDTVKTGTPEERLITALKTSEKFSCGVAGPFKIVSRAIAAG